MLILKALDPSDPHPIPGRTVQGKIQSKIDTVPSGGAADAELVASLGFTSHKYVASAEGVVKINLPRDFGLQEFREPTTIQLVVTTPHAPQALEVSVQTSEWTKPRIRTREKGFVFSQPKESPVRGEFGPNQRFWLPSRSVPTAIQNL